MIRFKEISSIYKVIIVLTLGVIFFLSVFLLYLYIYSIPEKVIVELKSNDNIRISNTKIYSETFLYNKKAFELNAEKEWIAQTGLIRSISITLPDSNYSQLSEIKILTGNNVVIVNRNKVEKYSVRNESGSTSIKISNESVSQNNFIQNFGLINFRHNVKLLIRSIFDMLCLTLIGYFLVLSWRLFKIKANYKADNKFNDKAYSIIPVKNLVFYSILVLLIPWFIFIGGYLKLIYTLILISSILLAIVVIYKNLYSNIAEKAEYSLKHIVYISIITALLIFLSGIGGLGLQNGDWEKHNFILSDLINHSWPVIYDYNYFENAEPGVSALVYYTGFYMIPALAGKYFGWTLANIAMIIQSFIALFLIFCWIIYFVGNLKSVILPIVLFIIFSGADIIGHLFNFDTFNYFSSCLYTESMNIQYTSHMSQLFWVPQHCFGAWLETSLLLYFIRDFKNFHIIIFVFAASVMWSAYIAIGLIPFIIYYGLKYFKTIVAEYRRNIFIIITTIMMLIVDFLYFSSKSSTISSIRYGLNMDIVNFIINLSEFAVLEWLLIFLVILKIQIKKNTIPLNLIFLTGIILLIIPFFPFTSVWDYIARASLPALFVLSILLIKSLLSDSTSFKHKTVIIAIIVLGIFAPIDEVQRSIRYSVNEGINFPPKINEKSTIPLLPLPKYAKQYMGDENSFFFRYLCKSNNENSSK